MKGLFGIAFVIALGASAHAVEPQVRVGFIGSFSGPAQIYGEASRNGFELARKEIGSTNTVVFYEDDQFIPAKTVAAFKKLTEVNKVNLVITIGSTPTSAVAALAEAKGIPLIGWASDKRITKGRKWVIRSYPSGEAEGKVVAELVRERGHERVAVVISNNAYAQSWKNGLVKYLPKGSIILDEELTGEVNDFKHLLLRAKSKGAQAYAICLNPGGSGLFAKQAAELDLLRPFIGCEYFHDREERRLSGGALQGGVFATMKVTDEFREKYSKAFGNESVISAAVCHYELAYLLSSVFMSEIPPNIVDAFLALPQRKGASGTMKVRKTADDIYCDAPLVIKEITEDGFRVIR